MEGRCNFVLTTCHCQMTWGDFPFCIPYFQLKKKRKFPKAFLPRLYLTSYVEIDVPIRRIMKGIFLFRCQVSRMLSTGHQTMKCARCRRIYIHSIWQIIHLDSRFYIVFLYFFLFKNDTPTIQPDFISMVVSYFWCIKEIQERSKWGASWIVHGAEKKSINICFIPCFCIPFSISPKR